MCIRLLIHRHRSTGVADNRLAIPKMRANQVGNFFRARGECRQEKTGVPKLVFIRRIVQDLDRFGVGGFLFVNRSRKSEMAEGFLVLNEQLIEEGKAGIEAMAENGVAKLVRYDGGQARFIRKHVDQAAAQHDGMADGVRFQRRVVITRQRTSGSMSMLLVTSRLL